MFMTDHNIKIEFPDVFNAAVTPVASRASETLIALWEITFGGIDNYANKVKYKRNLDLESFKNQLINDVTQIPKENIIEPKLSIMGPAIESSKYYYEEPELRNMFSKLIASSMNSAYQDIIRTSFTSIIKELEPIDASNMKILSANHRLTIGDIRYTKDSDGTASTPIVKNLFVHNPNYSDHKIISSSLTNLERLGLVTIQKVALTDKEVYDSLLNSSAYKYYSSEEFTKSIVDFDYDNTELVKGYIELTTFGQDFVKICL